MLSKQGTTFNVLSHNHLLQSLTKISTQEFYQAFHRKASKSFLLRKLAHPWISGLIEPKFKKQVLSLPQLQPCNRWYCTAVSHEYGLQIVKWRNHMQENHNARNHMLTHVSPWNPRSAMEIHWFWHEKLIHYFTADVLGSFLASPNILLISIDLTCLILRCILKWTLHWFSFSVVSAKSA